MMTATGTCVADVAAFSSFAGKVRERVDARLGAWMDERVRRAGECGADVGLVVGAVRDLAMRGGKRVRPVLLAAAFEGCGGAPGASAMAEVAFELLQAYLLIHDDWMDDDDVRRGGPSVHAHLRERFGSARSGDSCAILAGDHAAALSLEALMSMAVPAERLVEAAREFARIQKDVVTGQLMDVRANLAPFAAAPSGAERSRLVEKTHAMKTGSYTVHGPLVVGAILAGAAEAARAGLDRFARPLGVAFQLRDDVLGVFGDPKATGKPAHGDLRQGKRTSLIAEAIGDPETDELMSRAFGVASASAADLEALAARIARSGARTRIEARIEALLAEARAELAKIPIEPLSRSVLSGAVAALGERAS